MCGRIWKLPLVCFLLLFVFCDGVSASLRLDITRGNVRRTSIAFAPMHSSSNLEHNIAANCMTVMLSNLAGAGSFDVRMVNADLGVGESGVPESSAWRQFNLDILLTGSMQELPYGRMKVRLFIWDIASGKELDGKSFNFDLGNWRTAAHTVSDHVFSRLTGERGLFNSRIVYLTESSGVQNIAVMEQGGANKDYLNFTKNTGRIGAVTFAPDGKLVAYTQGPSNSRGRVMLQALDEETPIMLVEFDGVGTSLSFAPGGKNLLITCLKDGREDIYSYNIDSQVLAQLTDNGHNNSSASFSPDGKHVVFASDKSSAMHLYTMHGNGSNVKKISSGAGGYKSPTWSPRGDLIAFAKVRGKSSYIGVMRPDGSREKILATGSMLGNPTWSPNGRVLMFTKKSQSGPKNGNVHELVTVDLSGTQRNSLEVHGNVLSVNWSSLLGE